jgi:CRISPR-associated protein Cmr3
MAETRFIAPLDVIFPRGNRLFGEAGQHGEAQMPPWPSLAAGAIRSRMLVEAGVDLAQFANGQSPNGRLGEVLGTPTRPGSFRVAWFSVAYRRGANVEPVVPLPADLAAEEGDNDLSYLRPNPPSPRIAASQVTSQLAVLKRPKAVKLKDGLWLNGAGLASYVRGEPLRKKDHTICGSKLWRADPRLGIGLDPGKKAAETGRLYTTEGIAFTPDWPCLATGRQTGFLVLVEGAEGLVPRDGFLRLGGDGRAAGIEACEVSLPEPDWNRIAANRRFRLILSAPGLFEHGWRIPGLEADNVTWSGPRGVSAHLVAAAVARAHVISGWDLAKGRPKPALRAAPAGSVYWLEAPQADGGALVETLQELVREGFWMLSSFPDLARKAEGFNNVMVGNWAVS